MNESNVVELDDRHWEEMVEKKGMPIVVMFYDTLCPYCALMMPHFEKYAGEFKGEVTFGRINTGKNPYSTERYGIMSTPTFKFFCSGRPVQEIVGQIYPTLLKKITEESLQLGKDCAQKSTPIDFYAGYV